MPAWSETIQTADWKSEKHVPAIECADAVKAGEFFAVKATLGKAVAHPNTTEHHIRWIQLYFQPEGAKAPFQVGSFEFTAHGESVEGPNKGSVFTHHEVAISMKTGKSGTLSALAYCNIHGVWQSSKAIQVV
ncbi:MAG: Neelaredoxin [Lentisphaerae bacterium RIFOXYB12_FULL_60_10]|nr:MAG: Neelaredoxin [Lentisphaerae bacterium RIFOXYA12_FULL_60_10]OGV81153.1 MAG: Neelaredoxin [Lentisphaerae bacterium RIFOXYB12_FULL_60_10]